MNTNEVLATLATERLGSPGAPQRPRQRLAVVERRVPVEHPHRRDQRGRARPRAGAGAPGRRRWSASATQWATVVKSGRTHLMDATPVTLGQEFGGYAAQVRYGVERLHTALPRLAELPLGGTAVGTGINTPAGFSARGHRGGRRARPGCRSPRPATTSRRRAPATRWSRPPASCARSPSACSRSATTCAGWAPAPAPGSARSPCPTCSPARRSCRARSTRSSPRRSNMVCAQVDRQRRRDRLRRRVRQLRAQRDAAGDGARTCSSRSACWPTSPGCSPTGSSTAWSPTRSAAASWPSPRPSIVTPLNKYVGYENAAKIAKQSLKERKTIRQVVLEGGYVERGDLTEAQLDAALDVLSMTRPPTA